MFVLWYNCQMSPWDGNCQMLPWDGWLCYNCQIYLELASWVALVVNKPRAIAGDIRDTGFDPWVGKIPWRRAWQPTLVFLPGEPHGERGLVCYSAWGLTVRNNWRDLAYTHLNIKIICFEPQLIYGMVSPAASIHKSRSWVIEAGV